MYADTNIACNDIRVAGHEGAHLLGTSTQPPCTLDGIEFHSLKRQQAYSSSDRIEWTSFPRKQELVFSSGRSYPCHGQFPWLDRVEQSLCAAI